MQDHSAGAAYVKGNIRAKLCRNISDCHRYPVDSSSKETAKTTNVRLRIFDTSAGHGATDLIAIGAKLASISELCYSGISLVKRMLFAAHCKQLRRGGIQPSQVSRLRIQRSRSWTEWRGGIIDVDCTRRYQRKGGSQQANNGL